MNSVMNTIPTFKPEIQEFVPGVPWMKSPLKEVFKHVANSILNIKPAKLAIPGISVGITPEEATAQIVARSTLNPEATEFIPGVQWIPSPRGKTTQNIVKSTADTEKFIPRYSFGLTPQMARAKIKAKTTEPLPWWANSLIFPYGTNETTFEISNTWKGMKYVYGYICRSGKESIEADNDDLKRSRAVIVTGNIKMAPKGVALN